MRAVTPTPEPLKAISTIFFYARFTSFIGVSELKNVGTGRGLTVAIYAVE
jgi:hypothetical protein